MNGDPGPARIAGIREIAGRFRTWFVDAYGVLHDGSAAFPGVIETLARVRQAGSTIVIVTNSAQRIDTVAARLSAAGIAAGAYHHVMSSGELTWRHIEMLNAEGPTLRRLFLLRQGAGPFWVQHLPNPIVEDVAQADLVVAASMPHKTEGAALASDLMTTLETAVALRLPMLIADSDETYPEDGAIRLGPGWIARRYLELGGTAIEFGKPHAPIFAAASALCKADLGAVIMVGDNLATDVAGANRLGLASLLVLNGGVHGGLPDAELAEAARRHGATPTYIAPGFIW